MKLSVLMVGREYPPHIVGGVATHTYHLVRHLLKKNVSVHVLSFGNPENSNRIVEFIMPRSSIISRRNMGIARDLMIPEDIARLTKIVKERLSTGEYDILHVQEPYVGGLMGYSGRKVVTIHDTSYGELRGILRYGMAEHNIKRTLFYVSMGYPMEFLNIFNSRFIIAPSPGVARELLVVYKAPKGKIRIIPNGVEEPSPNEPRRTEARKMLGFSDDEVIIFTTAQHIARKRLDLLIRATSILRDRGIKGFRVIIGGRGPLTSNLQELIDRLGLHTTVSMPGWLSRDELIKYYNAADVFVVTSDYEAGPITLLEAGIRGKPIVSSRIDGFPILMEDGVDGLLFRPGDPIDLANKLETLITDEGLRKRLGRGAYKFASRFTWDRAADMTIKVYRECLEN